MYAGCPGNWQMRCDLQIEHKRQLVTATCLLLDEFYEGMCLLGSVDPLNVKMVGAAQNLSLPGFGPVIHEVVLRRRRFVVSFHPFCGTDDNKCGLMLVDKVPNVR